MLSMLSNPIVLIVTAVGLIIAITVHEFAHAFTADRLGDPTPSIQHRLSLNPLVHLDPLGTVFLVLFGFGWGKPVEFDPYNLKNPRRDGALIALAGPASNLILALILSISYRIVPGIIGIFFQPLIYLNVMLAVFNLLPIYPLDGFRIVGGLLNEQRAHEWMGLQRFGIIFLIAMLLPIGQSSLLQFILNPLMGFVLRLLSPIAGIGMM